MPDKRSVADAPGIIQEIVDQHAEEAAFLWRLRDRATDQLQFTAQQLAELDQRIEAHLDGLLVAGEFGLKTASVQCLQYAGAGDLFVLSTLALEDHRQSVIDRVLDFAECTPGAWRGLFGAIGWVSAPALRGRAAAWLDAAVAFRRLLGVVACSLHCTDPRSILGVLLNDEPLVRARALRLVGELGRVDLLDRLAEAQRDENDSCRFWAAWSAGLLGERTATVPVLQTFALRDGPFRWRALDLVIRIMDRESVVAWLRELARDDRQGRLVVVGAGVHGDPVVVPWLIEKMSGPAMARLAGEAFSMITGADLSEQRLEGLPPEGFSAGPTDEPGDENVAIDPDESLSWPDPAKVRAWWRREERRFNAGMRHLRGTPLTQDACEASLREGCQRHRRAAAYELALMSATRPLWNWRVRGGRRS